MRIALAFNRKPENATGSKRCDYYAEWDEQNTISAIIEALSKKHTVIEINADDSVISTLKKEHPDIVFNIAEGIDSPNREAQIPVICEMLRIPYTGSDAFTLSACLIKFRAKEIMYYHNIPTPRFQVLRHPHQSTNGVSFPAIVKPLWEGSSMGIWNDSIACKADELPPKIERILREYKQPALVETFLNGREFTAALLGNGESVRVLPLIEIDFSTLPQTARKMYSYEAKWVWDKPDAPLKIFRCPANIDGPTRAKIESVCKKAFLALGCKDWCRIDVRLDDAMEPHILELNPLPGILPDPDENSCFPKAARAADMSYEDLIEEVLSTACKRYGIDC
jgi:D-alanine-D-alanine ligase